MESKLGIYVVCQIYSVVLLMLLRPLREKDGSTLKTSISQNEDIKWVVF